MKPCRIQSTASTMLPVRVSSGSCIWGCVCSTALITFQLPSMTIIQVLKSCKCRVSNVTYFEFSSCSYPQHEVGLWVMLMVRKSHTQRSSLILSTGITPLVYNPFRQKMMTPIFQIHRCSICSSLIISIHQSTCSSHGQLPSLPRLPKLKSTLLNIFPDLGVTHPSRKIHSTICNYFLHLYPCGRSE